MALSLYLFNLFVLVLYIKRNVIMSIWGFTDSYKQELFLREILYWEQWLSVASRMSCLQSEVARFGIIVAIQQQKPVTVSTVATCTIPINAALGVLGIWYWASRLTLGKTATLFTKMFNYFLKWRKGLGVRVRVRRREKNNHNQGLLRISVFGY